MGFKVLYNVEMKKAAFLDLDQTLYNGYLFYEWIKFLHDKGHFSAFDVLKVEELMVMHKLRKREYIKTARLVAEAIGSILKGHNVDIVGESTREFTETIRQKYYSFVYPLTKLLTEKEYQIVLVTNEPDFLAEILKGHLNAYEALGIDYEVKDGVYTGVIKNDLASKKGKAELISKYSRNKDISLNESVSMGDSPSDIEMMKLTGKALLVGKNPEAHLMAKDTAIQICQDYTLVLETEFVKNL